MLSPNFTKTNREQYIYTILSRKQDDDDQSYIEAHIGELMCRITAHDK